MFDNVSKQEPDDIFANVDGGAPAPTAPSQGAPAASVPSPSIRPAPPLAVQPSLPEDMGHHTSPIVIGLIVVGILLVLGVAGFLSYYFLSAKTPATPTPPAAEVPTTRSSTTTTPKTETTPSSPEPTPSEETAPVVSVDTDKDGLTDEEEAAAGTNPRLSDSDADGLFDFDELKKYGTDPLRPDTDGDSYKDGDEVKNGYNPSGPGKLLPSPTSAPAS